MPLFKYACPQCGEYQRIGLWREVSRCHACDQKITLVPGMFSNRLFQLFFVLGALCIGVSLGNLRWSLGMLPYDMDQLVLDLVSFWIYAWLTRIVYFQFQKAEIVN